MQVKQEEEYYRKDVCGRGRNGHLLLFYHKSFPSSPFFGELVLGNNNNELLLSRALSMSKV